MKLKDKILIYFTWMHYSYVKNIDKALQSLIIRNNVKIEGINDYALRVYDKSSEKCIANLWNQNKWFSWLSILSYVDDYHWDYKRPSRKMMIKVYEWLEKQEIN